MNSPDPRTNQFLNLTEAELKAALIENAYGKKYENRIWFSRFKFAYDAIYGDPAAALNQGLDLLNRCNAADADAYAEIHKGGAFYWLGIASFLVREYELATFFFDAAVSEDIRWGDDPESEKPSPAMLFMRMDGEQPNQNALGLVQTAQKRIEGIIKDYNALSDNQSKNFTMQALRECLFIPSMLDKKWSSLTSTFISYFLEWDYRNLLFDIRPSIGTFGPFYIHLFKGCLLFESLLKDNKSSKLWKPTSPWNDTLGKALTHYSIDLGSQKDLGKNISGPDLQKILKDFEEADDSIFTAINFTARIRNTLGHNLGWDIGLSKIEYFRLYQMIACSCIHVINCLY